MRVECQRDLTSHLDAIDNLVAHDAVHLLGGVLDYLGCRLLGGEAGGECPWRLDGDDAGSESGTAKDEGHDVGFCCWRICVGEMVVGGSIGFI